MCLKVDSLRTLNSLQRLAYGIGFAAKHLELGAFAEVGARFVGTAKAVEYQSAVIIGPRVAAAALNRRIQRIERAPDIAGIERVNATAVKVFEHGVLRKAVRRRESQEGGDGRQDSGHERRSGSVPITGEMVAGNLRRISEEPAFIVVRAAAGRKQGREASSSVRAAF
jgi:hypothetical protein